MAVRIFDCELLGTNNPKFLTMTRCVETGEVKTFWHHKRGDTRKLTQHLLSGDTFVGFNSENFDRPILAAAIEGYDEHDLKKIAQAIINEDLRSWATYREFNLQFLEYDHIDLMEVPPGVHMSLKAYEGRMHSPTIQDMPFDHTKDLTPAEMKVVENYCLNDITETMRLYNTVKQEIELRVELGKKYSLDLRSKSDAQCAEAILKKVCGIRNSDKQVPRFVEYKAPKFITTDSPQIKALINQIENHLFAINPGNGSPEFPDFLKEPLKLSNGGEYQFGIGGLHSTHDVSTFFEANEKQMISDIDAASYYPKIMISAGLIPYLGGKGELFLNTYREFYETRLDAKRKKDKRTANTLKIILNGTFGKLGSLFCAFYSPELMLAVTLTGQLNLLCLIYELQKIPGVVVRSANTDGIMVSYPPSKRKQVFKIVQENSKRTDFEYEETPYERVAIRDVNSYMALTEERPTYIVTPKKLVEVPAGKADVKRKGVFAKAGVMENVTPTFQICAEACAKWFQFGTPIEKTIRECKDMREFVSVRNVKGGGVQHTKEVEVDDWVCTKDVGTAANEWMRQAWLDNPASTKKPVKRKSRPAPVTVGTGGKPFGRIARWYMTTQKLPAITYCESGNTVAETTGGKLLLTLPTTLPKDIDYKWYIAKAWAMLEKAGCNTF